MKHAWEVDFTDIDALSDDIEDILKISAYFKKDLKLLSDELEQWINAGNR